MDTEKESYEEFTLNVIRNLEKNGYPEKRVSLPLDRMYEIAYEKGLNFNKVLTILEEKLIAHEKTTQKLIFFPKPEKQERTVQEMMAEAQKVVSSMSPEERENLTNMFKNMTPEQQAEIFKKAKEMGLA